MNNVETKKWLEIPLIVLAQRKWSTVLEARGKYERVINAGHANSLNLSFITYRMRWWTPLIPETLPSDSSRQRAE